MLLLDYVTILHHEQIPFEWRREINIWNTNLGMFITNLWPMTQRLGWVTGAGNMAFRLPFFLLLSFLPSDFFLMHNYFSYIFFLRGVYFAPTFLFSYSGGMSTSWGVKYTPLSQPLFRLHLCLARLFVKKERRESPWLTHGRAVHDPPISQDHHMAISFPQSAPS